MSNLISIGKAAKMLGVHQDTLREWDRTGKLKPERTAKGHRRYDPDKLVFEYGVKPQLNPFTHPQQGIDPLTQPSLLPPGEGQVSIPAVQQFVALLQAGKRYYFQSDQAVRDSQTNAQIMLRNLSIMEPLQSRMLSACQMPVSVEPPDKRDKNQMRVAQELQQIIEEIPNFFNYKWSLLWALWYGRSGNQNVFKWDFSKGYKRMVVSDWTPINGDSLVYKWDSPAVGIRVGVTSGNSPGTKEFAHAEPADFSRVEPLSEEEREATTIHTFWTEAGTFLDPYSAGNIKGTGYRNIVYWTWYLQNQCLAILTEYLERMGTGFTVVTFQHGNSESLQNAQTIAAAQSFNNVITWPRFPDQSRDGQDSIYRIEPTMAGIENFMRLIDDYWNSELRRMLVGQDATGRATPGGLGSDGAANVQESTFFRLVKMDCTMLEETLTRELLWVIQKYTFPEEFKQYRCKVKISTSKPDQKEYLEACKAFIEMGGTVIESEVRQTLGLTEPMAEDKVLGAKPEDTKVVGVEEDATDKFLNEMTGVS